jgi:hypothetical protein
MSCITITNTNPAAKRRKQQQQRERKAAAYCQHITNYFTPFEKKEVLGRTNSPIFPT